MHLHLRVFLCNEGILSLCASFTVTLHRNSHHGRSSPGSGLSVHCHPRWHRLAAVPRGSAPNLPLWSSLVEEKIHSLQGGIVRLLNQLGPLKMHLLNSCNLLLKYCIFVFGLRNKLLHESSFSAMFDNIVLYNCANWCTLTNFH